MCPYCGEMDCENDHDILGDDGEVLAYWYYCRACGRGFEFRPVGWDYEQFVESPGGENLDKTDLTE